MRNLLLALLLANILYFIYARFVEEPQEWGVVVVDENDLGPKLELGDQPASEAATGVDAVSGSAEPAELAAVVGRSCVSVGPFDTATRGNEALEAIRADGMSAAVRAAEGQVFIGHWVHIADVPDRDAARGMLETLSEGGLEEAYLVDTEEEGLKIALGMFGEVARAERVERDVTELGLPVVIEPRYRDAEVYFVDIGLPPGRGAADLVSEYGESRVLLRERATCPAIRDGTEE